jgi:thiosulfate dehydrogenase
LETEDQYRDYLRAVQKLLIMLRVLLVCVVLGVFMLFLKYKGEGPPNFFTRTDKVSTDSVLVIKDSMWVAPDTAKWVDEPLLAKIRYGRDLIVNTAKYLGPNAIIKHRSNGMNCQNCHLDAGTKIFGNNYGSVASTYPKFRERSGSMESIPKRINDCFRRSLNGDAIDTAGKEMLAMVAYIKWLGKDVAKGTRAKGSGLKELPYMDRAASPEQGEKLFKLKCISCHQANGAGKMRDDVPMYQYPPLWGENSYNSGAGLYRLARFASFIKYNMPQGATYTNPQLSDEEAWDLAAYVNSQTRPAMDLSKDWPNIQHKPVDHPFGPYADTFTENTHKYGPFKPIKEFYAKTK